MLNDMDELYNRQASLRLKIPKSACVIGCGGVGSWVAINLALTGVKKLVLVDHDKIEYHNLNRIPFTVSQVGIEKVNALLSFIALRRMDTEVVPIPKKIEDCNEIEMDIIKQCEVIIDCRDSISGLPEEIEKKAKVITCGYDGYKVTIHINRNLDTVWGDEPVTYTITPSWLVPPQFLASIITLYVCVPSMQINTEKIFSFDMRDLIKILEKGLKEVKK